VGKYDYDVVVIGGGAGGFTASKLAHGMGKRVAMIEKDKLGGDCTWHGCVPSKALLKSAKVAHQSETLARYGLSTGKQLKLDTSGVMTHVRSIVRKVAAGHKAEDIRKEGIDVLFGSPQFTDRHSLKLGAKTVSSDKFILSTGSSPFVPPVKGLADTPHLTNSNVFDLKKIPASLIVLGGGPIGSELASAFNRLGSKVTLVEKSECVLSREDEEMSGMLCKLLAGEGINFVFGHVAVGVTSSGKQVAVIVEDVTGKKKTFKADQLLVAVGQRPNVDGLALERAGVEFSERGIKLDSHLRTTAGNIYACGDVAGSYQFSHLAEYQAVIATSNALLPIKKKVDYSYLPWCTFTEPELARSGLSEAEARDLYGDSIKVYRYEYSKIDRARTDVAEEGMGKFICDRKGKLLGAHILGARAGELIHEAHLVRVLGLPFERIQEAIHIYPTYADVVRQPAKLSYVARLLANPFIKLAGKLARRKS
jgi:pyruvate/2-oxoglutarate dehydrogenase complex dihydrolipoamide dehydrogenase (E3) component